MGVNLEVKIPVNLLKNSTVIKQKKNIKFETFNLQQYIDMFEQLVEEGHILAVFDNYEWELPYSINDYPVVITFDLTKNPNFNLALKAYVIVRVLAGRTPITIYNEVLLIKKAILVSDSFFNLSKLDAFLEKQNRKFSYQGYQTSIDVKRFVSFYKIKNRRAVIDICSKNEKLNRTARKLPNFQDVIVFDEIVNDYFKNKNIKETLEFLPIMLWWLLTNVLPLRPSEFLSLKKDCLIYKDGYALPYKIKVPRSKNKSDSPGSKVREDLIDIDEKTYNLLKEAINQINTINTKSEYLFPVELLFKFRKVKYKKKNERINLRDFGLMKKQFYERVVETQYNEYGLERIKSGDTRHFAIINMALQGFNMLSIARMAGHGEIKSQYSYYSHAEHFAQSYVYQLARKKSEQRINNQMESGVIGWKRYLYDKGKSAPLINSDQIVGKVHYGYCNEKKSAFPNNCIEYCEYCPKYYFHPDEHEKDEAIAWLSNTSTILESRITESIELMRGLSMNLSKIYREPPDDILKNTSRKLLSYMDMKATIDSNLIGESIYEKK